LDQQCIQRRSNVHRTILGLFGGIAGTPPGAFGWCVAIHRDLRISSDGSQLGLLVFLFTFAGLTSGTFYPLTLTFALRNIPLRYLALVLALYVFCIEGAVNFAPSLYGFFRNHVSWKWMFWLPAIADDVHLLRDTIIAETEEQQETTELCWILLSQCWFCTALRCCRSRAEA
jgi:hypothetical protein